MTVFKTLKLHETLLGLLLSMSLTGEGMAALSGGADRIRRMILKRDFPGCQPAMDTQQQFIVFSPNQRLSRELLGVATRLRREIYNFFGVSKTWDQPAFILIFPTRERSGLNAAGGAAVRFRYHGENVRIVASYLQEGLKQKVLPHEMVHFLIADLAAVGSERGGRAPNLPVLVNEGIAEYFTAHRARRILFEKSVWESFRAARLEPLTRILTSTESRAEALIPGKEVWEKHAQGYSVISFLTSLPNGNVKLRNYTFSYGKFANRMSRESASLRAFETAFGRDYSSWEELQNRWLQFIRDREIVVIEAESASVVGSSGEKWEVRKAHQEKLFLSGEEELLFHASRPGSFLTLRSTMPAPGAYDVYAIYTAGPRSGRSRLALNGSELPGFFDGYARNRKLCEPLYYGKSLIPGGALTVHFSVLGKKAASRGFDLGVDCLLFRRDRRLEEKNRAAAQKLLQAGSSHYRGGRFREAETSFSEAINLQPGNMPALEWRAHVRMAMGKLDEAQQDVTAALKIAPENPRLIELGKRIEEARKNASLKPEREPDSQVR